MTREEFDKANAIIKDITVLNSALNYAKKSGKIKIGDRDLSTADAKDAFKVWATAEIETLETELGEL
jgi:hypothetical protein